ncbi:MAG: protein phosphatase 2C domain-containing protein [Thermofilum sp.]|nr:protein phosphatase 2C domain-containing protein [Thermofilum sp.]
MARLKNASLVTSNALDIIESNGNNYIAIALSLRIWVEGYMHWFYLLGIASNEEFLKIVLGEGVSWLSSRLGLSFPGLSHNIRALNINGSGGIYMQFDNWAEYKTYESKPLTQKSTYKNFNIFPQSRAQLNAFKGIIIYDGSTPFYRTTTSGKEYKSTLENLKDANKKSDRPIIIMGQKLDFDARDLQDKKGFYSYSNVGKVRKNNEDAALNSTIKIYRNGRLETYYLLAVADGVGGAGYGELASKIAIVTSYNEILLGLLERPTDSPEKTVQSAIETANQHVLQEKSKRGEMGTTLTLALINGNRAFIGHVGDSRAYVIEGNKLRQITKDHKYVEELVERGVITREQAKHHPQRNIITSALGMPTPRIDISSKEAHALLLATDGLVDLVEDEEIEKILREEMKRGLTSVNQLSKQLVGEALRKGGYDNVSVSLMMPLRTV